MSVGWLLGSSATQTRQFANEHGSAAVPARGVAGGGGEPRRAAWPGGRPARSCPAPPRAPPPSCHRFVTGTMGTPRCTLTAPGSRAGSASRYLVIYKKNATRKSKMNRKHRHPLLAFTRVCRPFFSCIFRSY